MNTLLDFRDIDTIIVSCVPFIAILIYFLANKLFAIIIKVSVFKNILVEFENRSSHVGWCTNLGGIIIYFVLVLSLCFLGILFLEDNDIRSIISFLAAITILFFIGLKDDLISISYGNKLIGQCIAFSVVILLSDIRLQTLDGIFGIEQLHIFHSLTLSYFAFFFIINAYNLSDGIDGLAGTIALLANLFFGFYFYFHQELIQSVIAFTLVGVLFAFLKFNFSERFKVIMGDSGSMVLGFVLGCQFINFLSFNASLLPDIAVDNSFLYLFVLFSYPIVDTTRIFFIRIKQGRSPFSADKNHLHHALIAKGLTHRQATQSIVIVTLVLLTIAYAVRLLDINLGLAIVIVMAYLLYIRVSFYRFPLFTQKEIIQ